MIAQSNEAMAVVLSLHVPSSNISTFDGILRELIDAARQEGRISGEVLRGPPGPLGASITSFTASPTSKASAPGRTPLSGEPWRRVLRPWHRVPRANGRKLGLTSRPGCLPRHDIEWPC
jgi:hypothetical protein